MEIELSHNNQHLIGDFPLVAVILLLSLTRSVVLSSNLDIEDTADTAHQPNLVLEDLSGLFMEANLA